MTQQIDLTQLLALPDSVLEINYQRGENYYNDDKIEEAKEIFHSLVMARPFSKRYWFAYASCLQVLKNYERAAAAWARAALLDDKDPAPHFHAAECLSFISDREQAFAALKESRKRCSRENIELLEKINRLENVCGKPKKMKFYC